MVVGQELLSMWVDNGFDPEVLDRDAIGLAGLSPALRYLNTRIYKCTILAFGGRLSDNGLHEMAISPSSWLSLAITIHNVSHHGVFNEPPQTAHGFSSFVTKSGGSLGAWV